MKYSIDSVKICDRCIFAYGWVFDSQRQVRELILRITYLDGVSNNLPVVAGKDRPDVAAAFPDEQLARQSGWSAYVGADRPIRRVEILVTLDDGTALTLPVMMEPGSIRLVQRLRQFGRTVLNALLGSTTNPVTETVHAADDSALIDVIRCVLQTQGLDRICLVLDHSMGGGANQFRREWVKERLTKVPTLAVLYFEVHGMTWALDLHMPTGQVLKLPCSSALPSLLAASNLIGEVFINDVVSFPNPVRVPKWVSEWADSGASVTIAVHDYLVICPSPFLLNDAGRYCGVPGIDECRRCIQLNPNTFPVVKPGPDIVDWRQAWGISLGLAQQILCFSDSSRHHLMRAYPSLDIGKISVVPHRVVSFSKSVNVPIERPLHLGVVGAIGVHKGADVLRNLVVEAAKTGCDLQITVFGTLEGANKHSQIIVTGPYQHDELPTLIESSEANVFLLPSICPETFSYVTHELIDLGLPLACFDLGAPADRVRDYVLGRVLPFGSAKQLLDDLINFHRDLQLTSPKEGP